MLPYGILVPAVGIVAWAAWTYNRLVRRRALLREAASGVDVQLRRRHDLVPALAELVASYAGHERAAFTTAAGRAARRGPDAETALSHDCRRLLALAEDYPQLRADAHFLQLQTTLATVEDEIVLARRYYNGCVRNYNLMALCFPSDVIARLAGFPPGEFFDFLLTSETDAVPLRPRGAPAASGS